MYFASRMQAGRQLAEKLASKYRYENCAVLALNDGGVIVGAQIASQLHCVLTLLNSKEIVLPRELEAIAGITANGTLTYNSSFSEGEIAELTGEFFTYIEQEKMNKMQELNREKNGEGTIRKDLLRGRYVIVVSDGLKTGFPVDLAAQYLKTVAIEGMVMAVPFASVQAVDHMHVLADDMQCLNVLPNYMDTDHYYDTNDVPDHKIITETIENIILQWR